MLFISANEMSVFKFAVLASLGFISPGNFMLIAGSDLVNVYAGVIFSCVVSGYRRLFMHVCVSAVTVLVKVTSHLR